MSGNRSLLVDWQRIFPMLVFAASIALSLSVGVASAGLLFGGPSTPPAAARPQSAIVAQINAPLESTRYSPPARPADVLYDQYNVAGGNSITSQNFEPDYDAYDAQAADDFVVPTGQTWN